MDNDEFSAIKAAGYTPQQLVDISLAIAVTTVTNVFNRINGTAAVWSPVMGRPGRAQRLICWKKRRQRYGENLP
jgi:hypothetical protein